MEEIKKPKLLDVINDTASTVRLQCTVSHTVCLGSNSTYGHNTILYKKGEIHSRNVIHLRPGHWRICPKKYLK